ISCGVRLRYCYALLLYHNTTPTHIFTLSLHDALPICGLAPLELELDVEIHAEAHEARLARLEARQRRLAGEAARLVDRNGSRGRSEEHTSELQSRENLVCRLLLEKKKTYKHNE